ncbi:hypothetical protein WAI453_007262 [Rhynchosporium graminicola]
MRYQNWDVLLFADQFKVPLQEFKTSCQVIQDPELHNMQLNPLLLPTVTSFIPGLPAGSPFHLDKHGEFEKMKFPAFHRELLSQSYWNPGDDLGRIKVVISEGFSREQPNYAFERIKNIVSFSFQHAPLDVLESSSIAWPNAAMWRQVALVGPYLAQHFSPHPGSDEFDAHSHSPRHGQSLKSSWPISGIGSMPPPSLLPRQPNFDPFVTDHSNNPAFSDWRHASSTDTSMPDYSSTNTRSNTSRHVSDHMQVVQAEKTGRQFESIQTPGAYETLCEALMPPAAPANTPDNGLVSNMASLSAASRRASSKMSIDGPVKAEEPTLPKPFGFLKSSGSNNNNIKSRKENIQDSPLVTVNINPAGNENATRKVSIPYTNAINLLSGAESNTASREEPIRKTSQSSTSPARQAVNSGIAAVNNENPPRRVSQPFTTTNNSGTKRQRVVTPAAAKVIDEEDEPRSSPSLRKASQASARTDGRENERVVLGGIENV